MSVAPHDAGPLDAPPPGTPCWIELATDNLAATMRFYGALFGWDYERRVEATGRQYVVALLCGEPVAGLRHHAAPILDWTLYLATDDLDVAGRDVRRLGGTVLEQRQTLPGVGAKLLIDDPSGATVGLCQPAGDWQFTAGEPGSLMWAEFVTSRATVADRFLGAMFGFEQRHFGDDYMVCYAGGDSVLARVKMDRATPTDVPPRWIAHFGIDPVTGFEETVKRARSLGARLRFKPYASAIGKVAVLSDTQGTRFAIIDPAQAEDQYGSGADDPYDD